MTDLLIETYYEYNDRYWRAYFNGSEPDENGQIFLIGYGKTEREATEDLMISYEFVRKAQVKP